MLARSASPPKMPEDELHGKVMKHGALRMELPTTMNRDVVFNAVGKRLPNRERVRAAGGVQFAGGEGNARMREERTGKPTSGISRLEFLKTLGVGAAALASAPRLRAAPGKASAEARIRPTAGKGMRLAIKGVTYTGIWYNGPAL